MAVRARPGLLGTVEIASLALALFNVLFFAQMFWLEEGHPASLARLRRGPLAAHPLFRVVPGGVAAWERADQGEHA